MTDKMKEQDLSVASRLSVAPMMDWTDRHCRYLHRLLSRNALLYTEMVTAPALVTFAMAWMVIGFTPLPEWLGLGSMANEAHLGGFVAGLALAVVLPVRRKRQA